MNNRHSVFQMRPVDSTELANVNGGYVQLVLQTVSAIVTIALAAGQSGYNASYAAGKASCEPAP